MATSITKSKWKGASLTLCPPFPAFSSPGFQCLIERCVRFTELGLGFCSTRRQSPLPGQFPYESSWDLFPHFGIPGSTLGSDFSDLKFLPNFPPPPPPDPPLICSYSLSLATGFPVLPAHYSSPERASVNSTPEQLGFMFLWGWWCKREICFLGFKMGSGRWGLPCRMGRVGRVNTCSGWL